MSDVTKPGIFGREPVAIVAAVEAVLLAAIAFGLDVTGEQVAVINTALLAVLALVARQQVTPNAKVVERAVYHDDGAAVHAGQANELPTGEFVRELAG